MVDILSSISETEKKFIDNELSIPLQNNIGYFGFKLVRLIDPLKRKLIKMTESSETFEVDKVHYIISILDDFIKITKGNLIKMLIEILLSTSYIEEIQKKKEQLINSCCHFLGDVSKIVFNMLYINITSKLRNQKKIIEKIDSIIKIITHFFFTECPESLLDNSALWLLIDMIHQSPPKITKEEVNDIIIKLVNNSFEYSLEELIDPDEK